MSLKAKLEAVIYAAEEPVTLAQLAVLFAEEAFEWKAEQDAARAAEEQDAEAVVGLPAELPLSMEQAAEQAAQPQNEPQNAAQAVDINEAAPAASELTPDATAAPAAELPQEDPAAIEAGIKRAARMRDREVRAILRQILDQIVAAYAADSHGVEIREIAGGFRMATKPECHDAVRAFVKSLKPPLKLSLPALETLAVIAYKQPVTAPEVNEIRGVDSSGVFGSLLARKLIATAGRKQVIGRPILYKTTKEFLMRFGLKDIAELPSMEEFEKMASELEEIESAESAANAPSGNGTAAPSPELDEAASEDDNGEQPPSSEPSGESNSPDAAHPSMEMGMETTTGVETTTESSAE
jgi:segregation and condensation protein B